MPSSQETEWAYSTAPDPHGVAALEAKQSTPAYI